MRIPGRLTAGLIFFLLSVPAFASPHDRDHRLSPREAAYRAGFDDGHRAGINHGEYDSRMHLRYDLRGRDHFREDVRFMRETRYRGDFKKGYRDGYRRGYREGYDRFAAPRRWRR